MTRRRSTIIVEGRQWTFAGRSSQSVRLISSALTGGCTTHVLTTGFMKSAFIFAFTSPCDPSYSARFMVFLAGGQDYQTELEEKGSFATFSVELGLGEDQLFAAFYGRGGAVVAPYYIYIAKDLDNVSK